jgi:hypothetical protein
VSDVATSVSDVATVLARRTRRLEHLRHLAEVFFALDTHDGPHGARRQLVGRHGGAGGVGRKLTTLTRHSAEAVPPALSGAVEQPDASPTPPGRPSSRTRRPFATTQKGLGA